MRASFSLLLAIFASSMGFGQTRQALGLVLHAANSQLHRAGFASSVAPVAGDLLFAGDWLETAQDGSVDFLYCPTKRRAELASSRSVRFYSSSYKPTRGVIDAGPVPICLLPAVQSDQQVSLRTYGKTLFGDASTATFADAVAQLGTESKNGLLAELAQLDEAIRADGTDLTARIARAVTLMKYGVQSEAARELRLVAQGWPGALWALPEIDKLGVSQARGVVANRSEPPTTGGQVFALLVGISDYKYAPKLQYAAEDAQSFYDFLVTDRGGKVSDQNIKLLKNNDATRSAIEDRFKELAAKAGPQDSLWLLFAAHGVIVDSGPNAGAYILAADTDPERPEDGLPMAFIQDLLTTPAVRVHRLDILVDACHAGAIGKLRANSLSGDVEKVVRKIDDDVPDGDAFAFLASGKKQVSYEGAEFGGGHGAFTYFVLRGLNGEAKSDDDSVNRMGLVNFVFKQVSEARAHQTPTVAPAAPAFGTILVPNIKLPGIRLPDMPRPLTVSKSAVPEITPPGSRGLYQGQAAFENALQEAERSSISIGRAMAILQSLRGVLESDTYTELENRVRILLENKVASVLQIYLRGDEVDQSAADFEACARYAGAALSLTPESASLRSKRAFCEGRVLVFEKHYPEAISKLEEAVRLDPLGSWSYNALGIAYLEMAKYEKAVDALRDAIRLSAYWAYPRHNLALARGELGDFDGAVAAYEDACRLADYAYLRYNLATVYYRLNRLDKAKVFYTDALDRAPGMPKALIGLGVLDAQRGRFSQAIDRYENALLGAPPGPNGLEDRIAARHNMALLLVRSPATFDRAVSLWEANIQDKPPDVTAYVSLGDAWANRVPHKKEDWATAAGYYRRAWDLADRSTLIPGRLIGALIASNETQGALDAARQAIARQPGDSLTIETLGDAEAAAAQPLEASKFYKEARSLTRERSDRRRLDKKLSALASNSLK